MYKSKIVQLLKLLNEKELQEFKDYVACPLYNKNKNCIQLLDILIKAAPDYTSKKIQKEAVLAILFPNKPKTTALRVTAYSLSNLLRDYMIQLQAQDYEMTQNRYFAEFLLKRGALAKSYNELIKQYEMPLAGRNISDRFEIFQVSKLLKTFNTNTRLLKNTTPITYSQVLCHLHNYTALIQLKIWGVLLSQASTNSTVTYNEQHFLRLIKHVEEDKLVDSPIINLWYKLALLFYNNINETPWPREDFLAILQFLNNISTQIHKNDNLILYKLLLNYTIIKRQSGELIYGNDLFDIYQYAFKKDLFRVEGYIPHKDVANLIVLGIKTKAFEKTTALLHQYKMDLQPKVRQSVVMYHLGLLAFFQKQYHVVFDYLWQYEPFGDDCDINAKILSLKTYYELSKSEAFLSLMASFKKHIQYHKTLSNQKKKLYRDLSNFMMRLYRIKELHSNKSPRELKKKIENTAYIISKDWLLEKADELIQDN